MKSTRYTDRNSRVLLSLFAEPTLHSPIAGITNVFDDSGSHPTKVVHFLGQRGWLTNVRGKGAGLLVEYFGLTPDKRAVAQACQLRQVLRDSVDAFSRVLDEYMLAHLLTNHRALAWALRIEPLMRIHQGPLV